MQFGSIDGRYTTVSCVENHDVLNSLSLRLKKFSCERNENAERFENNLASFY